MPAGDCPAITYPNIDYYMRNQCKPKTKEKKKKPSEQQKKNAFVAENILFRRFLRIQPIHFDKQNQTFLRNEQKHKKQYPRKRRREKTKTKQKECVKQQNRTRDSFSLGQFGQWLQTPKIFKQQKKNEMIWRYVDENIHPNANKGRWLCFICSMFFRCLFLTRLFSRLDKNKSQYFHFDLFFDSKKWNRFFLKIQFEIDETIKLKWNQEMEKRK